MNRNAQTDDAIRGGILTARLHKALTCPPLANIEAYTRR
jgi:hypothetical protein